MRRKDKYVMMKRTTPKRVTLPNGRTFVARYKRVPRSRLPPHIKLRRKYRGAPARPDVIDSLSNRTNNKAIKKLLNANITKATVNKGTRNLRRRVRNLDIL